MIKFEATPATPELVDRFYEGRPAPFTFRGYAGLLDDRVVGLAGIHYRDGLPVVFADFAPDLGRKHIVRGIRMLEGLMLDQWKGLLFAVCDQERTTAHRTLTRLGFEPMATPPWYIRLREGDR